jgi:DNA-binding transcriptional LysR family regulator
VSLDLNHVRAFVTTAELLHFGRAAQRMHLTQQGLSHRISRLEHLLGERLFIRDGRSVELTAAGRRFLPHARQLLVAAELAVAQTRDVHAPLRVDVWAQLGAPLRWLDRLPAIEQVPLDLSTSRSTSVAVEALLRGEIDAAFGRLVDRPLPPALRHAPVGIEPMGVLVPPENPWSGRSTVRLRDLRGMTLVSPAVGVPAESVDYRRQLAAHCGMLLDEAGGHPGLAHLVAGLAGRPDRLLVLPLGFDAQWIRITDPTPYFLWTMFWRPGNREDELAALRAVLAKAAAADAPPAWDPATCWLPDPDLADLQGIGYGVNREHPSPGQAGSL